VHEIRIILGNVAARCEPTMTQFVPHLPAGLCDYPFTGPLSVSTGQSEQAVRLTSPSAATASFMAPYASR